MARVRSSKAPAGPGMTVGFLLSQVGAHVAASFAERLEPLGLKPSHVGILSVVRQADGLTQQGLAERLGMFPSRLVGVIDEMEKRGLLERRDSPTDRRSYAIYLTDAGGKALADVGRLGLEHQDAVCAALDPAEREQLAELLSRIAAQQGLTPGIHPGYRRIGGGDCT